MPGSIHTTTHSAHYLHMNDCHIFRPQIACRTIAVRSSVGQYKMYVICCGHVLRRIKCAVITMWILCDYYVITMWILCEYCVITMWLLCDYYVITMWLLCDYYVITMCCVASSALCWNRTQPALCISNNIIITSNSTTIDWWASARPLSALATGPLSGLTSRSCSR